MRIRFAVIMTTLTLLVFGSMASTKAADTSNAPGQDTTTGQVDIPFWVVKPCKTEYSVNCRWNAQTQGNGRGHTYVVRQFPGKNHMVCVMYADRQYAKKHDYCA